MTVKHTPGPWVVVADESAAQVKGFPCIYANGYTVVGTEGMFGDLETDFANAHLIAAAPDMKRTLEACDATFERLGFEPDSIARQSIRKVLEKSEGKVA